MYIVIAQILHRTTVCFAYIYRLYESDHLANGYFDIVDHYVKCKCVVVPTILMVLVKFPMFLSPTNYML